MTRAAEKTAGRIIDLMEALKASLAASPATEPLRIEKVSPELVRRLLPNAGDKLLLGMLSAMVVQTYLSPDNGTCPDCHGEWLYRKGGGVDLAGGQHLDDCLIHLVRAAVRASRSHSRLTVFTKPELYALERCVGWSATGSDNPSSEEADLARLALLRVEQLADIPPSRARPGDIVRGWWDGLPPRMRIVRRVFNPDAGCWEYDATNPDAELGRWDALRENADMVVLEPSEEVDS